MNIYYIYQHRRLDNNEIFYIGKSKTKNYRRAFDKSKRSIFWKNIIKKTNYSVEIIYDKVSKKEINNLETSLIKQYGRRDLGLGTLVNLTDGGDGGHGMKVSEETKLKLSNSLKGKMTDEHKQKIINSNKTRIISEETLNKFRNSKTKFKKGNIVSEATKLNMSLNSGKSKKVICIKTEKIWNSAKECAIENNLNRMTLCCYLNGSRKNKTNFKYLEDGCN